MQSFKDKKNYSYLPPSIFYYMVREQKLSFPSHLFPLHLPFRKISSSSSFVLSSTPLYASPKGEEKGMF
jgi:hypothetical protein